MLCRAQGILRFPRYAKARRSLSSSFPEGVVHKRGEIPYGSREYILLPPSFSLDETTLQTNHEETKSLIIASLRAHRNIIFGARVLYKNNSDNNNPDGSIQRSHAYSSQELSIDKICPPLLKSALNDASVEGEQVQALSTLYGLSEWVMANLNDDPSVTPSETIHSAELDAVSVEAVRAIASGVPRLGHSVVGQGTFRDGQGAWETLAKEFVQLQLGEEARLYQQNNGELVAIESLADTSPEYIRSAGGAMARFFFV